MKKHWKHSAHCSQKNNWIQEQKHPGVFQITTPKLTICNGQGWKKELLLCDCFWETRHWLRAEITQAPFASITLGLKTPCAMQQRCCCCCTGHPYQTCRAPHHNVPAPGFKCRAAVHRVAQPRKRMSALRPHFIALFWLCISEKTTKALRLTSRVEAECISPLPLQNKTNLHAMSIWFEVQATAHLS